MRESSVNAKKPRASTKPIQTDHRGFDDSQTEDGELQYLFPQYAGDADDISTAPATAAYPT
jgi:hypothetical protein